ncbi:MAG: phosphoribosylanthranilate isomerase [Planctomycetota bacterium]
MWIKICGITRTEDALAAMQAGVDAIGLNCFPDSKRFVPPEHAVSIAEMLRETAAANPRLKLPEFIGVFVNAATDTILQTVHTIGLTGVQFHGDETAEQIYSCMQQLPGIKCIRALRVSADRVADCLAAVTTLQRIIRPDAVLLDAFVPGQYGGTGRTVDPSVPAAWRLAPRPPLVLAGGLTPENVARIINAASPAGVDTASGVESAPGIKDPQKIRSFVESARRAFAAAGQNPR